MLLLLLLLLGPAILLELAVGSVCWGCNSSSSSSTNNVPLRAHTITHTINVVLLAVVAAVVVVQMMMIAAP